MSGGPYITKEQYDRVRRLSMRYDMKTVDLADLVGIAGGTVRRILKSATFDDYKERNSAHNNGHAPHHSKSASEMKGETAALHARIDVLQRTVDGMRKRVEELEAWKSNKPLPVEPS